MCKGGIKNTGGKQNRSNFRKKSRSKRFSIQQVKNLNKQINWGIKRQINWGIKVCYFRQKFDHSIDLLIKDRILSAELFISKFSLMKLQTDIRQWENFKMFSSRHNARQNKGTNQIIKKKENENEVE